MCTHAGRAGMRMERKDAEWGGGSWGDITFLFLDWVAPWPQLEGMPGCSTRKMSLLDFIMYETANQTYLLIYSRSFPLTLTPAVSVLPHFQGKYHTFYSAALIHPPKCMLYKSGFTYKACGEIIKYDPFTKQCIQFELTKKLTCHLKKIHRGTSSTQKDPQPGVWEPEPFCCELSTLNTYFFSLFFFLKNPPNFKLSGPHIYE